MDLNGNLFVNTQIFTRLEVSFIYKKLNPLITTASDVDFAGYVNTFRCELRVLFGFCFI